MTVTVRAWQLGALIALLLVGGLTAAFLLGRSSPQTKTVVNVISIPGVTPTEPSPAEVGAREDAKAQSDVRSAIPAAEAWYQDPAGGDNSYTGLDNAALADEAPGVSPTVRAFVSGDREAYCLDETVTPGHSGLYIGGDTAAGHGFRHLTSSAQPSWVLSGATCTSVGATTGS